MSARFDRVKSRHHPSIVAEYCEVRLPQAHNMELVWPSRPHSFIEFSLGDAYEAGDTLREPTRLGCDVVLIAPHVTRLPVVRLSGYVHEFHIGLQPTALHRLCRADLRAITDQVVYARDVIGWRLDMLRDAVMRAANFEARVAAADRWIEFMLEKARPVDLEDAIAFQVRHGAGRARIDMLQGLSGLSERHWRRRFAERVGVGPKTFARVTRLEGAFTLRLARPQLSWTEISLELGYYDHSHMLRDARDFLNTTPAEWIKAHPWPLGPDNSPHRMPS